MLARRALAECPDCADAYVLLAERTADLERALELYTAGAAAGPRRLDARFLAEYRGELWGEVRARPWLRALFGQAVTLARLRRFAEARAACDELLRLDKGDPLGVRKLKSLLIKEERRSARGAAGGAGRGKAKSGGSAGGSAKGRGGDAKARGGAGGEKKKGSGKRPGGR